MHLKVGDKFPYANTYIYMLYIVKKYIKSF